MLEGEGARLLNLWILHIQLQRIGPWHAPLRNLVNMICLLHFFFF